jgi:hypothetical protein
MTCCRAGELRSAKELLDEVLSLSQSTNSSYSSGNSDAHKGAVALSACVAIMSQMRR